MLLSLGLFPLEPLISGVVFVCPEHGNVYESEGCIRRSVAKTLQNWLETEVQPLEDKSVAWLSQFHFFRDPNRPTYSDLSYFFSPADGIILYQEKVKPADPIVSIKGRSYSLRDALREPDFRPECLVIGIFMTFYDVHVNRIPYPGQLS